LLPVILALDPPEHVDALKWASRVIDETSDLVAGYKIGLPLILRACCIEELLKKIPEGSLTIADLKLADIGDIMLLTIRELARRGFRAFIVHGFIGWRGALEDVSRYLRENNYKLITVISMSHAGSAELIDRSYEYLVDLTIRSSAWGCVIGASKLKLIEKTRRLFRERGVDIKILSPGVGVQGVMPKSALKHGADYEIVGRLITWSANPRDELKKHYGEVDESE